MKPLLTIFSVGFILGVGADLAFFQAGDSFAVPEGSAAPAVKEVEEPSLPPSGTLASSGSSGYSGKGRSPAAWGGDDLFSGKRAPISGSIAKEGDRSWSMSVNNSDQEATYSIDVSVEQYNVNGDRIKLDSYSYTLAPGASQSRTVGSPNGVTEARLELRKWRKHESKKPAAETTPKAAGK